VAYSQKCKTSQILLGVANYYRRFIERYAQRSVAFRELLAKDKPCVWGEAQEKAFNYLRELLAKDKPFVWREAQEKAFNYLRELLAKDKPCVWGEAQEKAFNYLKLTLSSPPILKFTDTNGDY